MKIRIGFSTCPNDTYIFDALINGKIKTPGLEFEAHLADVEELNQLALKGELDVTKLSYHAYGHVTKVYKVLDSGSALGFGNGPLLVSKRKIEANEIQNSRIAIPGKLTTANLLLGIAYPGTENLREALFSDIEEMILNDEVELGVLIHETRFTYQERGLTLIKDLGQFWEEETQSAIPLGGIVVKRDLRSEIQLAVQEAVRSSLQFAIDNPGSAMEYMKEFAQEMDIEILQKHVRTFVNAFSLELGDTGRKAIINLLQRGQEAGLFSVPPKDIFV